MNGKELETAQAVNASIVRTRRLEILDSKSHTRAFVDTLDGEAVFCLTNEQGLRAVEIRAGKESGAQIALIRDGESTRFVLALTKTNRVMLSMLDADGNVVYSVGVDQVGKVSNWKL